MSVVAALVLARIPQLTQQRAFVALALPSTVCSVQEPLLQRSVRTKPTELPTITSAGSKKSASSSYDLWRQPRWMLGQVSFDSTGSHSG
jgi:hypothetical protein